MRIAAIALVVALAASTANAQAPVPFRIGITAATVNMLPVWMADAAGLFKSHGLAVKISVTDGGSKGLAEVGQGKFEAMIVGLSAVIDANGKGGDYRLIASSANTMAFGFFGAKGLDAAGLKGKKIGVSTFASESDVAASLALKRVGLSRADVTVVESGATLTRLEALKSGALAATALNEPANLMAARAQLPKLVDLAADEPWIFTGVVMDRSYIAAHRATVMEFLKAYVEGIRLALADERNAQAVLAQQFKTLDRAGIAATYADFRTRVPRDAKPSLDAVNAMLQELPDLGFPVSSADPNMFVDFSFSTDLAHQGFHTAMDARYGDH